MRLRLLAGLLLVVAGSVQLLAVRPAREVVARAAGEQQRLRDERRELRARIATLERDEAAFQRAADRIGAARTPAGRAAPLLRRGILTSLAGVPLSGVRISVRPATAPAGASASLVALGPLASVVSLAGEITRPGSGLVLARVRFAGQPGGVALELDAYSLQERP